MYIVQGDCASLHVHKWICVGGRVWVEGYVGVCGWVGVYMGG